MHLLTYYINSFMLITSAICHCLLITFAVNHAVDEWSHRLLASYDAKGGHLDILNIAYDCYSQNDNVLMIAL